MDATATRQIATLLDCDKMDFEILRPSDEVQTVPPLPSRTSNSHGESGITLLCRVADGDRKERKFKSCVLP